MKSIFVASLLFLALGMSVARADVGLKHVSCFADYDHKQFTYEGPFLVISSEPDNTVVEYILGVSNGRCVFGAPETLPPSWCPFLQVDTLSNPPCVP